MKFRKIGNHQLGEFNPKPGQILNVSYDGSKYKYLGCYGQNDCGKAKFKGKVKFIGWWSNGDKYLVERLVYVQIINLGSHPKSVWPSLGKANIPESAFIKVN